MRNNRMVSKRRTYRRRQSGGFYPSVMGNLLKSGYIFIVPCITNAVKVFQNHKTRRNRQKGR